MAGTAFADPSEAMTDHGTQLTPDADLINKIHAINELEESMGRLAEKNADNDKVKEFAQTMIKDHGDSDLQLIAVASSMTAPVVDPESPERKPEEVAQVKHEKAMMEDMKAERGARFEHDYLKMMIQGHDQALEMLSSANPSDPRLMAFVQKIQPIVDHHRQWATNLLQASK
jgi:putative membrane protein